VSAVRAAVTVSADDFALSEFSTYLDGVECTLEQVAVPENGISPLLWIAGADTSAIDAALTADASVQNYTLLATGDGERLYRIEWSDAAEAFIQTLTEHRGVVLSSSAAADLWHFELLFPDRGALSRAYDAYRGQGIAMDVVRISQFETRRDGFLDLTRSQYEALQTAYHHGFYEVPRGLTQTELAAELGVSHQSLSECLRRAHGTLINQLLHTTAAEDKNTADETGESDS
jgi:predicted DNA binding protein